MVSYRRIKVDRIKKYAISTGIVGVPLLAVLFMLLTSLGAIEIISHSGDSICAGTELDPCIANVVFKAKTDIYIYPINESDQTALLQTDKKLKSIVLKRSWGKGYRTIYLNKTWSSKVKYALKLHKGQIYNFTYFAYKKSPYEDIKWAVNYEDREYLDPVWKGKSDVIYTPTTDTTCLNGKCNLILYSRVRNVYEDNRWKRVENARSLKGSGIECIVESDGENLVECVDWNMTSIKLKLSQKSVSLISKEVPIKIYEKVRNEGFKNGSRLVLKSELKESFNIFSNQKQKILSDFEYGNIIHFGEKSTTIKLQDNETENLEDARVYNNEPNNNFGVSTELHVVDFEGHFVRSYIRFNISSIPLGSIIEESGLFLYLFECEICEVAPLVVDVHHVYNKTWVEGSESADNASGQGSNTNITWNNQPCGTAFDDSAQCNLTAEDSVNISLGAMVVWIQWNVTNLVKKDYDENNNNVSLVLKSQSEGDGFEVELFYSKEGGVTSLRPYLNITYTEAEPEDTCTCPGAGNNWEVNMSHYCNLTAACTLTTGNLTWIGTSGYFNCSANLNLSNRDAPPSGTTFYHSSGCEIIYLIFLIFSIKIIKDKIERRLR